LKEQPGALVYVLYAGSSANRPYVYFNAATDSSGEKGTVGSTALPLNTWSHLAGTYDGATLRLYVNGVLAASQPYTGSIITSSGALRLGGNAVWGEYFTGRIDEVRIYNRALSQSEIQVDMNTAVGGP
jgi:hydrogenase maturation factor HypE